MKLNKVISGFTCGTEFQIARTIRLWCMPRRTGFLPVMWVVTPNATWLPAISGTYGNVDGILADCDIVLERTYHTKAFNQAMMEPFTTYADFDRYGRLHIISSTQIVFHTCAFSLARWGFPEEQNTEWKNPESAADSVPANCRLRSLSCLCCNENRSPGYDLLYPVRKRRFRLSPP